MEDIIAKIQGMELSKTDSLIAEHILDSIDTIGLKTSTSLAEEIGVSDTSIIRFIRKLGFKGYSDFRVTMTERLTEQFNQSQGAHALSPGERYVKFQKKLKSGTLISDISKYTVSNLEKSFSKLTDETVDKTVDILLSSEKHYICGFRGAASCAQYMASKLVLMVSNIITLTHADATAIEAVVDIKKGDCIILYSFPRYSEINFSLLEIAREAGAQVILFTDKLTSPLVGLADIVIVTCVSGLGFTNSYVAPLSISELLLLAISNRNEKKCMQRISKIDKLIGDRKLY